MAIRRTRRGLLIMVLPLVGAPAWGGALPASMEAGAPMGAAFESMAQAGVIAEHLQVPLVLVFNHHGQLALTIRGKAPEGVAGQVAAALRDSDADQPDVDLEQLTSRFFPATSSSRDGGAIFVITMDADLCTPCKTLVAKYFGALEGLPRDTHVSVYTLTIQRAR